MVPEKGGGRALCPSEEGWGGGGLGREGPPEEGGLERESPKEGGGEGLGESHSLVALTRPLRP